MENKFNAKLNDFTLWSLAACEHYRNGLYADSLINMRKSGEAACKLMYHFRYSEKTAAEKTEDKTLKDLIYGVINNHLAPRAVINCLETIQIHGNDAAHDTPVSKDNCELALKALGFLIDWIFKDLNKGSVPEDLKKAVTFSIQTENTNDEAAVEAVKMEMEKVRKEKEELEKKFAAEKEKNEIETKKMKKIEAALQKSEGLLREFEKHKRKLEEKAEKLSRAEDAKFKKNQLLFSKRTIAAVIMISLTVAAALIIFSIPSIWTKRDAISIGSVVKSDSFKVVVLPLAVLQDNPNMSLNFEKALDRLLRQKIVEKNIPVNIFVGSNTSKESLNYDEAITIGKKANADIVIFGDLYEAQSPADSSRVNLKYAIIQKTGTADDETGLKSFIHLSDSSAIKIMMNASFFIYMSYGKYLTDKGKYNQALALLYDIKPAGNSQRAGIIKELVKCYIFQKNYLQAKKELEKYIKLKPDDNFGYAYMATISFMNGEYKNVEKYFIKALAINPCDTKTLLNYVRFLYGYTRGSTDDAISLLKQTIQCDSLNITAWFYLGNYKRSQKDFTGAEKCYRKILTISPKNPWAKLLLARVLSQDFDKQEEAEKILIPLIYRYPGFKDAVKTLMSIYTKTKYYNAERAALLELLYKKIISKEDKDEFTFTNGDSLFRENKYDEAIKAYLEVYAKDSFDFKLCNNIGTCYMRMNLYDKAVYYCNRAYMLDSFDCINNMNMGYIHSETNEKYKNLKKAAWYYEKALKTCPENIFCLEFLSELYFNMKEYARGKQIMKKLYDLDPTNVTANLRLGMIYRVEEDFKKGAAYLLNVLGVEPDNALAHFTLAVCIYYDDEKNYPLALVHARKAVELEPEDASYNYSLSQFYIDGNDYANAKEYYDKAVKLDPSFKKPETEVKLQKIYKKY